MRLGAFSRRELAHRAYRLRFLRIAARADGARMTAATARIAEAPRPAGALEVFTLRCWGRARLFAEGEIDLHTAVDVLQLDAERDGLVTLLGQDAVQKIISKAFGVVR
jgi:hypothetical protein